MTTKKIDPNKTYIAGMSWAKSDGTRVRHGERVKGNDPRLLMHPEYFIEDGESTQFDALAEASVHEARHQAEDRAFKQSIAYKLEPKDIAVASVDFEVAAVDVSAEDIKNMNLTSITVHKGDRLYRGSPLVQMFGHHFEVPKQDIKVNKKSPIHPATAYVGTREPADND